MNRKIKIFTFILSVAFIAGCANGFDELNRDPNRIALGGVEPSNLIEPILITGTNALANDMTMYAMEMAQMCAKGGNVREEQAYIIDNAIWDGRWNMLYRWANNAKHMSDMAAEQNDPNYEAIGIIMKVYYLASCSDLFGSIAYNEALKALEQLLKPRIDSQQEAFTAMMADLERANAIIDPSKLLTKPERDQLYKGDMAKWKKFANSLHLRLLMRVSGRNDAFTPTVAQRIKTIADDPVTYPVFASNADNASVKLDATATYYRNNYNTVDIPNQNSFNDARLAIPFLNLTVYDFDTGECDPRLRIWGKPTSGNSFKWRGAIPAGNKDLGSRDGALYSLRHWETLVRDNNPNLIMDYAELLFILSEAAFNGWISGNAKDYYEAAITASCQRWNELGKYARFPDQTGTTAAVNILPTDITAMLEHPKAMYNGTLERIQTQKWVALFWVVGYEPFSEMRRTGYPDVPLGSRILEYNRTGGKFIARFGYPVNSIATNNFNYEEAVLEQKGSLDNMSNMTLPVWWSGQSISIDAGNPWPHAFRTVPHRYAEDSYSN